ncbi:arsenite methyltransferase [candidate division TA06 bacterium]|nr:arsenite methyltransferase [candidate division TA06 bacterium]
METGQIKQEVRRQYAKIASGKRTGCGCRCGDLGCTTASAGIGYSADQLSNIPKGSDMGLGCGNPLAIESLHPGETVLDLGSGGGIDCFLAAKQVGENGKVIGVDMTPEMIDLARENAGKVNATNVEFRLGEIEHLPVADQSVDVIISNCVINLSPDKHQTFAEAYRALKHGGRLMVSDIVLTRELPEKVRESVESYVGCVAGAVLKDHYLRAAREAGFSEVKVTGERHFAPEDVSVIGPEADKKYKLTKDEVRQVLASVVSVQVFARKPPKK